MDLQDAKFDWIAWYASIPGIPAGWGSAPAGNTPATVVDLPASLPAATPARPPADLPERIAA